MIRINLNQNIPNHYAFTILLVISFLVAWYIISVADRIVKDFPDSEIVHVEKKSGLK